MFITLNKKGQSILEYTIILTVVVAAILMMQVYVKRAVQGKARDSADEIGEQYSVGYSTSNIITNSDVITNQSIIEGGSGMVEMATITNQSQNSDVSETTPNYSQESWPQ
ncbi:MAG: hypothetical protein NC916_03290 [Candidatus Omnitrophica bacterium]|nr:hypothetical protein [Candidatus Omnitrophota bacterium]